MLPLLCVRCLNQRCICGGEKFLMHKISCWGFSSSNLALQECSFRSLRPSMQKSKSSLYLSHSVNPSNNKYKSLSTDALPCCWEGKCSSQAHGGCNHRAPCLHHLPRTGEGSSKVFMCSAHLMGESDSVLLLLLCSEYRESPSWGFVGIVMRCVEEWCRVEIPPRISCFKLSIYTLYFKAIFRKTPWK